MKEIIEKKYNDLFTKYHFEPPVDTKIINSVIKSALVSFLRDKKTPAIYCYGGHTKMLMADFMFELKNVKLIIDNYYPSDGSKKQGFRIIKDEYIETERIDAIILSSYKYRESISKRLEIEHKGIPYLDLYEEIEKAGIVLHSDYYYSGHPFHYYKLLNSLQNSFADKPNEETIKEIIFEYIRIKDFTSAISWTQKLVDMYRSESASSMLRDIKELYGLVLQGYSLFSENNVIMLLFDGLRRRDFCMDKMPGIVGQVKQEWTYYENMYAYSTSTFESLIPTYSQNTDQKTKYYEKNYIHECDCEFIQVAKQQGRDIYFYTDVEHYIESDRIHYSDAFLTLTEKLWQLLMDGVDCKNGLFYLHSLYETHYSFCNPYTKGKLISEGTAILFDFLPQKGGELRTNYVRQQNDALAYVNDVVSPILHELSCNIVLFADHGNLILENGSCLENISTSKFLLDEEWIQIPMAVKMPNKEKKVVEGMHSLLELSDIISQLLNQNYKPRREANIIKCGRSQLYNPDFKYIYNKLGLKKYLMAFEGFIFSDGYKLIVFSDGSKELFSVDSDELIEDEEMRDLLYKKIVEQVTVIN